jgi:hypothetical protein
MNDKAQLQALGTQLRSTDRIEPATRCAQALAALVAGLVCDPPTFARAILEGATVERALAADIAGALAPLTPEESAEGAAVLRRMELRREVTQAAIAETDAEGDMSARADSMALVRLNRRDAVRAYLAAGGVEVIG